MRNSWDPFNLIEKEFSRSTPVFPEPAFDSFETGGEVVVTVELPGVKKEDIGLHVDENGLSLEVNEKEEKRTAGNDGYSYSSRFQGYSRYLSFPSKVDAEKAKATFKNGVLEIRVPKKGRKGNRVKID